MRKLAFLKKVAVTVAVAEAEADMLVGGVMRAFLDERQSLCLVRECKDLEEELGVTTNLTGRLLTQNKGGIEGAVGLREVRESVSRCGKEQIVESCKAKALLVAEVAQRVSWSKVWDACMDLGIGCTRGIQALVRVMCHHGRGSRPCPLCDCSSVSQDSLLGHLLVQHRESLNIGSS